MGGRALAVCARFGFLFPGGHRRGETPVPIPNTVVKPSSADGTAGVAPWESRSLPGVFQAPEASRRLGRSSVHECGDGFRCPGVSM
jgi:hypothetical protein